MILRAVLRQLGIYISDSKRYGHSFPVTAHLMPSPHFAMAPPPLGVVRGRRTLREGPWYPWFLESEYRSKAEGDVWMLNLRFGAFAIEASIVD